MLHTCCLLPDFVAAYKICFILSAYVAAYKAFILDLSVGKPVFSASSLSYALRIASVSAVYFSTRAFSSDFFMVYKTFFSRLTCFRTNDLAAF